MAVRPDVIRAELMHSISEVARAVVEGRSASVALLDELCDELVFVAAAGEGAEEVVGARFPRTEGIAGEVVRTGRAVQVGDVAHDPHFAADIAIETGVDPETIAAVPLYHGSEVVGVLEVLDPGAGNGSCLPTLATLAAHASAALDLTDALQHAG